MELEGLQKIATVAGIGGLSLGTLMLIFRQIIRKNIFPKLTKRQSFNILVLIITLSFAIAVIGLVSYQYIEYNRNKSNHIIPNEEMTEFETLKPYDTILSNDTIRQIDTISK